MAEEPQQVTKELQQVTKEPKQVTTKDPKKVAAGKHMAEINRKRREEKKAQAEQSFTSKYYGIEAVIALGVIGGYYIYRAKKPQGKLQRNNPPQATAQPNKFEMD